MAPLYQRSLFGKRGLALLALLLAAIPFSAAAPDKLVDAFREPPRQYGLRCYWYWLNGDITKEGITKDLEAMKRVGIIEPYIGIIDGGGPLKALTPEWWDLLAHAVREASRLDMDLGVFNCPGWSQSGGPWVKPEQSMRYLHVEELRVTGPREFAGKLPAPEGFFQDVAVLAFPAPRADAESLVLPAPAAGADAASVGYTLETPLPFTARSLVITPSDKGKAKGRLLVSDDGQAYREVRAFEFNRGRLNLNVGPVPLAPLTVAFPAVTSRWFRVVFDSPVPLADVSLRGGARLDDREGKQLIKMFQGSHPKFDFYTWKTQAEPEAPDLAVAPAAVQTLDQALAPDGTLRWQVPAGEWIIQRLVARPTGVKNDPAPPEAAGPEIDKMSRAHIEEHFNAYVGKLLALLTPAERKSLKHVIADSYEMGSQNWTDDLFGIFRARYGYDPRPYLPVLSGRVVSSALDSDRFLWDLRRLIADRTATEYVGGLREVSNRHGLRLWLENYGHWGFPAEFLQYGGQSDEIGGEFWQGNGGGTVELRAASSAAQLYGMPQVFAEAFTGGPAFSTTPWDMKKRGDWVFTQGINQFILHVYIHQPDDTRIPGINAWYGTEFNRHNTWFEQGRAWMTYLRRNFVLLQEGHRVADVAYFIGEDTPKMTGIQQPRLPDGYDYDYINAEVILTRVTLKDGRFVLPTGASYRVLALPDSSTMRPQVLRKLGELARAGGTIIGTPPARSPSLENQPAADAEVARLADELWSSGLIKPEKNLAALLTRLDTPPALQNYDPKKIGFTHRRSADADIFFLTNQSDEAQDIKPAFRATGAPELWHADDGAIERTSAYAADGPLTHVTLRLEPRASVFVVFRAKPSSDAVVQPSLRADDTHPASAPQALPGPWNVTFDPRWGGPADPVVMPTLQDWTQNADEGIRYYSGKAVYRTRFVRPPGEGRLVLDLGDTRDLATVRVNGRELGTLWKKPWRLDITTALRPGENDLEIEVVNTWRNRLVGDTLPETTRKFTSVSHRVKTKPTDLLPAGLLGPVTLQTLIPISVTSP